MRLHRKGLDAGAGGVLIPIWHHFPKQTQKPALHKRGRAVRDFASVAPWQGRTLCVSTLPGGAVACASQIGLTSRMNIIGKKQRERETASIHYFSLPMTYSHYTPSAKVDLPMAPVTMSPVPHLTSLHSTPSRGPWGSSRYPGNCSGYLIKDLVTYFKPRNVFDPMTGSGTCRDVCRDLKVPCTSFDVRSGFDAGDSTKYAGLPRFDFIWLHPPYWRMKRYSKDPCCLSNATDIIDFYKKLQRVIVNCSSILSERGKIAILMGDYFDPIDRKMIPCVQITKDICLRIGLWPACTDIIRFQHNNSSSKKQYNSSFIPGLHDVCCVMEQR